MFPFLNNVNMLQVVDLFGDQVDLIEEFGRFLPGPSGQPLNNSPHSKRSPIPYHNYKSSSASAMRIGRAEKVFPKLLCVYYAIFFT